MSGESGKTMLKHSRDSWLLDLNSNHPFRINNLFFAPKLSVVETDRNDLHCKLIVSSGKEITRTIY